MINFLKPASLMVLFIVVLSSCHKSVDSTPSDGSDYFVSSNTIVTLTKTQMQAAATLAGYASAIPLLKYDVEFRKIIYKTTFKGNTIQASGLLAIPKNVPGTPTLLSAQHGTMLRLSDAPSNFPAAFTGFELFAAAGFITVMPDFIGYGVSSNIAHPYYDRLSSGIAVVDMLKATKYHLRKDTIAFSNRLFLLGYSEGGYVTMAAQREIETHSEHNLTITAAAEGAGGYDLQGMLSAVATTSTYNSPSFLALIIKSYNTTYSWNRPYSDYFREPYATRMPSLLDGSKTADEINAQLTNSVPGLLNPVFYANLLNPSAETVLKQALITNSFLDWYPVSPTRLYHGTKDSTVFYSTSLSTYNKFKASGAPNVTLVDIPNGDHGSSIEPMMLDVMPWFVSQDK